MGSFFPEHGIQWSNNNSRDTGSIAVNSGYKNSTSDGILKCLVLVGQLCAFCCVELLLNGANDKLLLDDTGTNDCRATEELLAAAVSCIDRPLEMTTCDLFLFESCDNNWCRASSELAGTNVPNTHIVLTISNTATVKSRHGSVLDLKCWIQWTWIWVLMVRYTRV